MAIWNGLQSYPGSKQRGVTSKARTSDTISFKFLGDIKETCNYFQENYMPTNIFENWLAQDQSKSSNGPS